MSKPVRIREFVASQVDAFAEAENRSFANMVEVMLLSSLEARGNVRRNDELMVGGLSEKGGVVVAEMNLEPSSDPPKPGGPPAVQPRVHDVPMRPHMRKDRPALQCSRLVPGGGTCPECGKVVV